MDSTTGFESGNVSNQIVFADDSLGTTLVGDTWKDVILNHLLLLKLIDLAILRTKTSNSITI